MLVLNRRVHEVIYIDIGEVRVKLVVNKLDHNQVSLAFDAPKSVSIVRSEVYNAKHKSSDDARKG